MTWMIYQTDLDGMVRVIKHGGKVNTQSFLGKTATVSSGLYTWKEAFTK